MTCPACNRKKGIKEIGINVYNCPKCDAVFGTCTLGDSYQYASAGLYPQGPEDDIRYFDLTCLSSKGIVRRHGWADKATGKVVQIG